MSSKHGKVIGDLNEQWIADRRVWLTADRQTAVEEGDPRAAFLLCAPGHRVPLERAEALGVMDDLPGPPAPDPKPEDGPPDIVSTAQDAAGVDEAQVPPTHNVEQSEPVAEEAKPAKVIKIGGEEAEAEATPLGEDFPAADLLTEAGLGTVEAVAAASDEDLTAINGIGPKTLEDIRAATG